MKMKKLPTILGGVMFVAFFMPWTIVSGMQVVTLGAKMDPTAYVLLLIPICAAVLAYFGFSGHKKTNMMSMVAGAVPLGLFLIVLIKGISNGGSFGDIVGWLGLGIWLTTITAIGCVLVGMGVIKSDW